MGNAIIAASFTLAGVILGVLLEPVKAVFARRALARQERADRCAQLVEAVIVVIPWLISENRYYRDTKATELALKIGLPPLVDRKPDEETHKRAREEWIIARQTIRKMVALLWLSGPEELGHAAQQLREAERRLRNLRQADDDEQSVGRDGMPKVIRQERENIENALRKFTEVARNYIR